MKNLGFYGNDISHIVDYKNGTITDVILVKDNIGYIGKVKIEWPE